MFQVLFYLIYKHNLHVVDKAIVEIIWIDVISWIAIMFLSGSHFELFFW